ncbi:MAG TPA: glycosyltransferase [Casimicrobiaceae bacterium]|nr:glycosyltransferase [Casimicrobiaceae bacterium]
MTEPGAKPTLTVLISSHNRVGLLKRTLRYLNEARRPAGWNIDVLVAANACTDGTHAMLDRYVLDAPVAPAEPALLRLRWVAEPHVGKSFALNCAIPLLTSGLVSFVDDDHRVDIAYLESVCRAAERYPDADILCGRILPDWDGSEPSWVHDEGPYRIYPLPVPRYDLGDRPLASPHEVTTPGGGNLVLRTALFDRVGDFSVAYGPVGRGLGGAEDHQWVLRAIASGAKVQYVPDIVQYHYVDPERLKTAYVVRKAYERSASAVRVGGAADDQAIIPAYMIRKAAEYSFAVLASVGPHQRRFHLVRLAASLGEIKGRLRARMDEPRVKRA